MTKIVSINARDNVAMSECGGIFEVEDYLDEEETPCLPEEAAYVSIMMDPITFKVLRVFKD